MTSEDGNDPRTLAFYTEEAEAYAARECVQHFGWLDAFLAMLPPGGHVLEIGCGGGEHSAAMIAKGFAVTPTDGSPEMARQAEMRLGRPVAVLLFDDLAEREVYDGVWANACLLHVPRAGLSGVIGCVHAALKPGGLFQASFKAGSGEGRDRYDRYYNYPSPEFLREAFDPDRWARLDIREAGAGRGYDGVETPWLIATAAKAGSA